jgi:hypothetical protein
MPVESRLSGNEQPILPNRCCVLTLSANFGKDCADTSQSHFDAVFLRESGKIARFRPSPWESFRNVPGSLLWSLRRVSSRQFYVFNEISHLVTFKLRPRQSFGLG